jgi:phospholipase C
LLSTSSVSTVVVPQPATRAATPVARSAGKQSRGFMGGECGSAHAAGRTLAFVVDIRDPEAAGRLELAAPDEYLRRREFLQRAAVTAGLAASLGTVLDPEVLVAEAGRRQRRVRLPSPRNMPIDTFVVLMMENRSFDHYLGWMPEADGRQGGLSYVRPDGNRQATYPLAPEYQGCGHPDPGHGWDSGRAQLNRGKVDGFLAEGSGNDEYAIGYYRERDLPFIPHAAKASTTFDRYFCSVLASTYPNREYEHAAQSYGQKGNAFPPEAGYPDGFPDTTIFAALAAKGIEGLCFFNDLAPSWLWGQPGVDRSRRIDEYYARCANGTLPPLSFVDPPFLDGGGGNGLSGDEHPHGDVRIGQAFMSDVVHAFMESPQWKRGALFLIYDEWGGFFDHVRPPRVPDSRNNRDLNEDFGQMGFRIPAVVISPYVRRGHVSHLTYGHESILKMIEYRYGLRPLTRRDAYARNIARSFDWDSNPRLDPPALPDPATVAATPCSVREASGQAASRPQPHDLSKLLTSGWMDRFGIEYRPWSPSTTFREPSKVESARRSAG